MSEQAGDGAGDSFLGDLSVLDLQTEYRSIKEEPARLFYRPCLQNSILYKRATGYFRSTIFLVTGPSVVEFAKRGGKIRLICSPDLEQDDVDSIVLGYARRSDIVDERLCALVDRLLAEESTAYHTRILATLIAVGALELKLAVRADRKGLYHEKIGVFCDGLGHRVSFIGSANETWSAWDPSGNFESIEVFCDWREGGLEARRVQRHDDHFESLWREDDPDVEVFPFPSNAMGRLTRSALPGLGAIVVSTQPSSPQPRTPLPHQIKAIAAWEAAGRRGIFEHATGSGKTFTAIQAIKKHVSAGKPTIVLVPSRLLLEQWAKELREEIPGAALLLAGGGHTKWRAGKRLRSMTTAATELGGRIVLATMQTGSTPEFLSLMDSGPDLLVVADEVHQTGSRQNSRFYGVDAGARLGLSATPKRYGDPEGTARMFSYFGNVVPPPITLQDAITAGRLVPYEYFPYPVNLTVQEASDWMMQTRLIQRELSRQKDDDRAGPGPLSDRAKMLLIKRSRIAKRAAAKVPLAVRVLQQNFERGQSWLVYCEDGEQLREVVDAIRGTDLPVAEYHSSMDGDREATLSWFKTFGGILVSIRCLDEGVDIPSISHALILASSQNPRQFIQRRGRVLRRSPGKDIAVIHDAIVVPVSAADESEQLGLLRSELVRAIEFSSHAINRIGGATLRQIAIDMGIDPDELTDDGIEGDDDNE